MQWGEFWLCPMALVPTLTNLGKRSLSAAPESAREAGLAGCALILGDIPSLREIWDASALFVPQDDATALNRSPRRMTLRRIVLFCHSLPSGWNQGNAHFLRGITTELLSGGHDVRI
jgi:hypothetical protein